MSNPAVHNITAKLSSNGTGESIAPRTAIQAPVGAIESAQPSARCENEVKRFVYE